MNKKKILFITHWYPDTENVNSGIFIQRHASAISDISELTLVHFNIKKSNKLLKISYKLKGENQFEISVESRFYKALYYFLPLHFVLFKKLIAEFDIKMERFDLVHSNVIFPNGIIGYKISKHYDIPQIHSEHWSKFNTFLQKNIWRKLGKKTVKNIKKLLPVSEYFKKKISANVPISKMVVIPNIIDSKSFTYKEKIKKNKITFLAVSNWQSPKNPFPYLDALETIYSTQQIDFELLMIGTGPLINKIISKNYPFKIHFKGQIPPNEISNYFHNADFFLHGSDFETFSIVVVEALKTGTPTLVSNVGIASEVINSNNGFICQQNSEDWRKKIILALKTEYNHLNISNEIEEKYSSKRVSKLVQKIYTEF